MKNQLNVALANMVVGALIHAWRSVCQLTYISATTPSRGKSDTLGFDSAAEMALSQKIRQWDENCFIITEEMGFIHPSARRCGQLPNFVYLMDPIDGSSNLTRILEGVFQSTTAGEERIGDLLSHPDAREIAEGVCGNPAHITSPLIGVCCIAYGLPIFSAHINLITAEIFLQCRSGLYCLKLPSFDSDECLAVDVSTIRGEGSRIEFRADIPPNCQKRFVGYCDPTGQKKPQYLGNLLASGLFASEAIAECLLLVAFVGPGRYLYLTQASDHAGLILYNGEKISEWASMLVAARFAKVDGSCAFRLFEGVFAAPQVCSGVLMGCTPQGLTAYSMFKPIASDPEYFRLNLSKLFDDFPHNPSHYRSFLVLIPRGNNWALSRAEELAWRELKFPTD